MLGFTAFVDSRAALKPAGCRPTHRAKIDVVDGIGIWLAARRLHQGHFVWSQASSASAPGGVNRVSLSRAQLDALVLGLPWSRIGEGGIISVV